MCMAPTVCASVSTHRSVSNVRISGCCKSGAPKAARPAACCRASCSALLAVPAEPSAQSSLVLCTISMIVRTPAPCLPSICAHAPLYSTSDDALALSPSLSFSRITWKPVLRVPSGFHRGTRKQESASLPDTGSAVCARVRNASHMGADVNHLCPVREYAGPPPQPLGPSFRGVEVVVLARTSEPPCFSVMDMPMVMPSFSSMGTSLRS
mmetsp:Transcript_12059/g.26846  ORF Transcript_12059/g.26846 Transcript_12059/m.26846 type:complete len:209 (-) Transcript_12059:68-694(-)